MASTEEVISTLLADDYIHSSIQFLIDENMRTVTVPPEGVVLGVTGDKDVNRINFKMVRHYDGLDLSTFQIRINYVNANGDANYYQVTDTTVEDDSILFTWLVSSDAAAYKGTVSFAARLYTVEDTIVKESFNSTIATAEVLEGIIVDEYMPPDAQQDLITLLLSQIEFPAGSNVGQVDNTEGATAHGEIFNDYTHNEATGGFSHAEGNSTTASGANSHAEGSDTTASSNCAHAEGFTTTASKYYSHAEGSNTTASGTSSHAEGSGTTASGYYSHAEGSTTNATADTSHAEGSGTTASGYASHAEGNSTTATAGSSHAEGSGTKASSANQHVQGKYNVEDTAGTYAMIIGNGTSDDARSNAFTVDWNGNIECGTVNGIDVTQISSGGSEVGQIDTTEGASHHGEIFNNYKNGYYFKNKATGLYSHAEGSDTTASGDFSHAEGYTAKATGDFSHAEGSGSIASGSRSHAEGSGTNAEGNDSHAEGVGTTASNIAAHTEGGYTNASGSYSHAEGYQARASGDYSHAEGFNTKASSANQHVQGKYNVEDTAGTYTMIIGNGSSNTARSNCFTVDWNGNIQCGKTDTSGNFTTYGTINGVDITDLLNRIVILESQLTPVVENLFDTSMIYHMLTEGYITHNDANYYYATVDSANNVISFIYDAKGMKILNDGVLFESDTQYVIEADIKTSTASEGTDAGTSYNGMVEIKYSDNTKVNALVNNTSEYTHVSYTTESGKTVENLYVKGDMISGLNVDTILYIKNLVIKKA